jgi:hypothetical protein
MQDMDTTYVDLDNAWGLNLFYHELGYAIAFLNYAGLGHPYNKRELPARTSEVSVGVVKEQDKEDTTIIRINDASTGINHKLGC